MIMKPVEVEDKVFVSQAMAHCQWGFPWQLP